MLRGRRFMAMIATHDGGPRAEGNVIAGGDAEQSTTGMVSQVPLRHTKQDRRRVSTCRRGWLADGMAL
jgi:hypothetical protein